MIEVEFVHLAGLDAHGQLTLLDTPGQMKPGSPICKMLTEQLSRASAVLAVMDYTQLKSISDEEVRQAISVAGKSVPLYALVNKFDQKDRNSDDEEQVRAMISGTLMKGNISPGQIYPVSSMWAYLANRARYEMANHGQLPDHREQRWVQDLPRPRWGVAGVRGRTISNIFVMRLICCGKIRYLNNLSANSFTPPMPMRRYLRCVRRRISCSTMPKMPESISIFAIRP